jgi:8-oxo-dGTP pyrophosphatase MutT (NUDIX family)
VNPVALATVPCASEKLGVIIDHGRRCEQHGACTQGLGLSRMSKRQKACPIVTRVADKRIDILAFRHPMEGYQLVKGTIEIGETIEHAAERELLEESGLVGIASGYLGMVEMDEPLQEWHFVVCRVGPTGDAWTHRTSDGGGLDFDFFWHPLLDEPDENWHRLFKRALAFVAQNARQLI